MKNKPKPEPKKENVDLAELRDKFNWYFAIHSRSKNSECVKYRAVSAVILNNNGYSQRQIARFMNIKPSSVNNMIKRHYDRLINESYHTAFINVMYHIDSLIALVEYDYYKYKNFLYTTMRPPKKLD